MENTWGALIPMIDDGPLSNVIPKTGEAFIRHPNKNRDSRVEIVTSKADGKLGARISSGKCDETGLWGDHNGMKKFMRTLRRGAAGMGGRVSESASQVTLLLDAIERIVGPEDFLATIYRHLGIDFEIEYPGVSP